MILFVVATKNIPPYDGTRPKDDCRGSAVGKKQLLTPTEDRDGEKICGKSNRWIQALHKGTRYEDERQTS